MVYEGIGYMISTEAHQQADYVNQLLQYTHNEWLGILQRANMSTNELMRPDVIKSIDFIIKVNQKVASSVGKQYLAYLS